MTLRRYVVRPLRPATAAVVWLSVVASYNVTAAQVGYDPAHSPYHDIPRGAVWALSVGHLGGGRGDVGGGPADGLTGALRYEVPFGAVGASLGLADALHIRQDAPPPNETPARTSPRSAHPARQ